MLRLLVLCIALTGVLSQQGRVAPDCVESACNPPDCRCFTEQIVPGGFQPNEIPQIVMLTFDDAVQETLYNNFYVHLTNKQNPNGCPIGATFFTTHEYADYYIANLLYNQGHELALHSMTHTTTTQYWADATEQTLTDEFAGQKQTLSTFANIPASDITGVRVPFLVLAGDRTFNVNKQNGFYDLSWPTQTYIGKGVFPYTLDYRSPQDCPVGTCPVESHVATWVVPMIDWIGEDQNPCAMVDACMLGNLTTADDVFNFMKRNFERHYLGFREPFGVFLHAAWFQANSTRFDGYMQFINYVNGLNDVYLVTGSQAVKWTRNPTNLAGAQTTFDCPPRSQSCSGVTCQLEHPDGTGLRYMKQCVTCPPEYPWLGNPLGESTSP